MTRARRQPNNIEQLYNSQVKLDAITMVLMNISVQRAFSFGVWNSRQHIFLKVSRGAAVGWGEEIISLNKPDVALDEWSEKLKSLENVPLGKMWALMQDWPHRLREMTEMALLDLYGKLTGVSARSILGLHRVAPVPGMYCILEQDPDKVFEKAGHAFDLGYRTHLKIKLFGERELDLSIIEAARRANPDVFLVGDVNMGYRTEYQAGEIPGIAKVLRDLSDAGLSACEDPAEMDRSQWIQLQQQVSPLLLIPDAPMRPAARSIHTVVPEMGGMFNIHPGSMGSILEAVELIRRIQSFGGKIMIGDNSLVGPACTVWQQIAIGCGAEFVEALEKEAELPQYFDMVEYRATALGEDGRVGLQSGQAGQAGQASQAGQEGQEGFGLRLNEQILKQHGNKWHEVF